MENLPVREPEVAVAATAGHISMEQTVEENFPQPLQVQEVSWGKPMDPPYTSDRGMTTINL